MSEFSETLEALRRARATRDDAREQLQRAPMRQLNLQRLQKKADRREILDEGGENDQPVFYPDRSEELNRERAQIQEQRELARQRNAQGGEVPGDLFNATPQS